MAEQVLQMRGGFMHRIDPQGHDQDRPETRFVLRRAWREADFALGQEQVLASRLEGSLAAFDLLVQERAGSAGMAEVTWKSRQEVAAWQAARVELTTALGELHGVATAVAEDCARYADRCWRQAGRLSKAHAEHQRRLEQLDERSQQLKAE